MPNAGLPQLTRDGASLPADARTSWPTRTTPFTREFGLALVGGCCGTTPEHLRQRGRGGRRPRPSRRAARGPSPASPRSTSTCRSGRTRRTCRSASAPTPTAPRRSATRCSTSRLGRVRRDRPRPDPRRRAPARRLRRLRRPRRRRGHAARSSAGSPPARRCRSCSTRPSPPVIEAGPGAARRPRGRQLGQLRGRRRPRLAVRPDHAARPGARRGRRRADHRRGGPGPHRRAEGRASPTRLIDDLTGDWGMRVEDIIVDCLTFPIATGQEETRRDGDRDDRGDPRGQAALPGGADDAGRLQRLVRPQPRRPGRAQLGLPARVRQGRARLRDRARRQDPADVPDPRGAAPGRARPGLRPPARGLRPAAARSWSCSRASTPPPSEPTGPPSWPRCRWGSGCSGGSSTASARAWTPTSTRPSAPARARWTSSTTTCSHGMQTVGELFGSRRDAAAVRAAVGRGDEGRGGLPRAAHGAAPTSRRQGHHRAGHGQGRRPRHRQEPRRHHPVQQRLHVVNIGIKQPISDDPRGRRRSTRPT